MKKILSLGLAVLMIALAIASCNKPGEGEGSSTPADSIPNPPASSSQSTPESTPESTPDDKPAEIVFADCDEKVYVIDTMSGLWLRSATDFDDDSAKKELVGYGTELRRIGKHETWSKVVYENEEYFASSEYLSTEKPEEFVFEDIDETVYVTEEAYIRSFPSRDDRFIVTSLSKDTELKRTGILYEPQDPENNPDGTYGWSRVEYEGRECYMRNSVLSLTKGGENTPEKQTYDAVKNFFEGLTDVSISGTITENDGSQELSYDALLNAKGLDTDNFSCYMDVAGTKIVYLDGHYYLDDGGEKVKMEVPANQMAAMFEADVFVLPFELFTTASIAAEGETTVLTLKGLSKEAFLENILLITKDMFETEEEYNEFVATLDCNEEDYTNTFTLDKEGKVTAFAISYSYSQTMLEGTSTYSYKEENTVSTLVADITLPEDADEYIDLDEM